MTDDTKWRTDAEYEQHRLAEIERKLEYIQMQIELLAVHGVLTTYQTYETWRDAPPLGHE